jgi:hypothetical protein
LRARPPHMHASRDGRGVEGDRPGRDSLSLKGWSEAEAHPTRRGQGRGHSCLKLPRDHTGAALAPLHDRHGSEVTSQTGRDLRLTSAARGAEHHITISRMRFSCGPAHEARLLPKWRPIWRRPGRSLRKISSVTDLTQVKAEGPKVHCGRPPRGSS